MHEDFERLQEDWCGAALDGSELVRPSSLLL